MYNAMKILWIAIDCRICNRLIAICSDQYKWYVSVVYPFGLRFHYKCIRFWKLHCTLICVNMNKLEGLFPFCTQLNIWLPKYVCETEKLSRWDNCLIAIVYITVPVRANDNKSNRTFILCYNIHVTCIKVIDIIIDGHVLKFNFINFFEQERLLQKKVVYAVPLLNLLTYFR